MRFRDLFGPAIGAVFICAAVIAIHYNIAIKPNLDRLVYSPAVSR